MELLRKLFGSKAPSGFSPPGPAVDETKWGHSQPLLRKTVEVREVKSAAGDPLVVLRHPEEDQSVLLTPAQYQVVTRLDGKTAVASAVGAVLGKGELPLGIEAILLEMYKKGFFDDPQGVLQRFYIEEKPLAQIAAGAGQTFRLLWGRRCSSRLLARLASRLGPLAGIFSNPVVFWISLAVALLGAIKFGQSILEGQLYLLPEGPEGIASILGFALGSWLFFNFAALMQAASVRSLGDAAKSKIGLRFYLGIPLIQRDDGMFFALPWQEALRKRLNGIALLGSVSFLMILGWIVLSQLSAMVVVIICSIYLVTFLKLSPWWKSPLGRSFSQALPGLTIPWACWTFLWKRFWGLLWGGKRLEKHEVVTIGFTIYLALWSILAVRLCAFVLKHGVVLLYRDAVVTRASLSGWILFFLAIVFGGLLSLAIVLVVMIIVIRGAETLAGLSIWNYPKNIFLVLLLLGLVLTGAPFLLGAEQSRLFIDSVSFLLFLGLGICSILVYSRRMRTAFSSGLVAIGLWSILCAISLAWAEGFPKSWAGQFHPLDLWSPLIPIAGLLLFVGNLRAERGKRSGFAATGVGCIAGILMGLILSKYSGSAVIVLGVGVVLFLTWGKLQSGGRFRRLSYLLAVGIGLLVIAVAPIPRAVSVGSLGLLGLAILIAVPLIYGRLKYCPMEPARLLAPGQSDRESLAGAVSQLWNGIQQQVEWLAGSRVVRSAREVADSLSKHCKIETKEIHLREVSADDLVKLGDELSHILDAASEVWLACCGQKFVRMVAEARYAALDWEQRQILAQFVFHRGAWWRKLLPDSLQAVKIDPEVILQGHMLFSQLPPEEKQKLFSKMRPNHFEPGENVVRQGEKGDRMYVILQGRAGVIEEDFTGTETLKVTLHEQDFFGEVALLHDCERTATVRALSDLWVVSISREDFQNLFAGTSAAEDLHLHIRKANRLRDLLLFRTLSIGDLELLAERSAYREYEDSETIIQEDDPGENFYVIDTGEVEVSQRGRVIRVMSAGQHFGSIALVFEIPRTATVKTIKSCRCLVIPGGVFRDLTKRLDGFRAQVESLGRSRIERDRQRAKEEKGKG